MATAALYMACKSNKRKMTQKKLADAAGISTVSLRNRLRELEAAGTVVRGEILPGGTEREWCEADVLRRIRRASLARLRQEVEPADGATYARFLASWQGIDRHRRSGAGIDRLREILVPLQGVALAPSVWERDVLPRRLGAYSPAWLDGLCTSGEIVWIGAGAIGRSDGRVAFYFREDVRLAGPPPANANPVTRPTSKPRYFSAEPTSSPCTELSKTVTKRISCLNMRPAPSAATTAIRTAIDAMMNTPRRNRSASAAIAAVLPVHTDFAVTQTRGHARSHRASRRG